MGTIDTLTDSTFDEEIAGAGEPVLVDFWAEWCGPCKAIAPVLEEIATENPGKIRIGKLNVDEHPEASRRFQSWVVDLLSSAQPYTRARGLTRYREHPDARTVHPNERALLPLLVVAGAASSDRSPQNVAELLHAGVLEGRSTASFRFRK